MYHIFEHIIKNIIGVLLNPLSFHQIDIPLFEKTELWRDLSLVKCFIGE